MTNAYIAIFINKCAMHIMVWLAHACTAERESERQNVLFSYTNNIVLFEVCVLYCMCFIFS